MSMFDNNDKDVMYEEIIKFLQNHPLYELFYIMSVVFKHYPDLDLKEGEQG